MAEFVMGCVQLGLAYGAANRSGKPDHAAALALVRRAVDGGIGCFDTARGYGDSEARLGEALSGRHAAAVTKLSPLSELSQDCDAAAVIAAVEASVSQSLQALRQPRLGILLLHRAAHLTAFGGVVWQRLLSYRDQGVIGCLGVSVQSAAEASAALGFPEVQHIQLPYNLLDWRWREAGTVDLLRQRCDVTVHARSVFLQGLLATNDPAIWPVIAGVDAPAVLSEIAELAADLERDSAADLCLAYVRGLDFIDGVVVGLETEDQLDTNLRLCRNRPLTADQCRLVEDTMPLLPETLLNPALWPKR